MKATELIKIQRSVDRIELGAFDENDIDALLIRLREFAHGNSIFLEIAHFVAHSDERIKGITNEALEAMYLNLKFLAEFGEGKSPLRLDQEFPAYVIQVFNYQIEKACSAKLKSDHNTSKKSVRALIKKIFVVDPKSGLGKATGQIDGALVHLLSYLVSFLEVRPIFSQERFVAEFIDVLQRNNLQFTHAAISRNAEKIVMCVLLLLHGTTFRFADGKTGECRIMADQEFINATDPSVGLNIDDAKAKFGRLRVLARIPLAQGDKSVNVFFSLMSTDLAVQNWCSDSLLIPRGLLGGRDGSGYEIQFPADIFLDSNSKLARAS